MISGDPSLSHYVPLTGSQWIRALGIGLLLIVALALILVFPGLETNRLEAGQVSPRTILAPERVTYASGIQTREARAKAEAAVKEVFDPPSLDFAREQVRQASRVLDYVDSVRHDPYSELEQKFIWVQAVPTITLSASTLTRTLGLDENTFHRVVSETLYVLDVTMRDEIRPSELSAEYAKLPSRVSLALPADQADLVTQWAKVFVVPNSLLNVRQTNELRAEARERVGTVYRTIEKGEAVLREGEVVTPLAIEALEALGLIRPRLQVADFAGPALLAFILVALLGAYLIRMHPGLMAHMRALLLIAFVISIFTVGAKAFVAERTLLAYLFPVSAAAMLLAVLVDFQVAIGSAFVLALILGFLAHNSLEIATYALAGGLIASMTLGRIERLPAFLWSGGFVALTNLAVLTIFRVTAREVDVITWMQLAAAALGNGVLSALVALGSLFVLGKLFGITTSLELLDLTRPTHPLLQRLLSDAPGTFHHSLIVSHMAEQAAQKIGADALLVRVGAYYHDIGKTRDPHLFIENQLDGVNIHDTLDPETSAARIIDHVSRGLALAEQFRLPKGLRDLIPQHHGTTLAAYFHRKALDSRNGSVDDAAFRYPGPKPQSREAAILMLADGVEATVRAERPATPEQIRAIIDRIVDERLRDGQLDECELTLRDIQQIKEAFVDVLQGQFHPRVKYPRALPTKRRVN